MKPSNKSAVTFPLKSAIKTMSREKKVVVEIRETIHLLHSYGVWTQAKRKTRADVDLKRLDFGEARTSRTGTFNSDSMACPCFETKPTDPKRFKVHEDISTAFLNQWTDGRTKFNWNSPGAGGEYCSHH